jgi:CBS domain-containing protein
VLKPTKELAAHVAAAHLKMPRDPRAEYRRRIEFWSDEIARADRQYLLISNSRLVLAAVIAFLAWQAFVSYRIAPIWPLLATTGFVGLAILHARMQLRIDRARRARQLYERGMARLDARWAGSGPDGARFLEGHPFARDLDLFGPASLFQLLHTARTEAGEDVLAAWLSAGSGLVDIRARQDAVAELVPKIDFREDLAVLAAETDVGRTGALAAWAAETPAGLTPLHSIVHGLCAAVCVLVAVLVWWEKIPSSLLVLWILIQTGISAIWGKQVHLVVSRVDTAAHDLALLSGLLARIEREPPVAPRLRALREVLITEGVLPSRRIARFERLVAFLDQSTRNQLFVPIAFVLLLRSQAAVAIDRWHAAHGPAIAEWLRVVGEMEGLSALATFAYEHPADPFPVLVEDAAGFAATALGHPLIDETVAVRNDVRLGGTHPRALIVSGSNMSGKSTMLRAVGVNVVLALAGAPVRAASLTLSRLAIGATIRVDDSLQAGQSRFYAEILRLRSIVDEARGGRPLVFLLDEILGGTNSYDRRIGAEAVLRLLVESGAIGLITTHDLALTELAPRLGPRVDNVHFEDRIENGLMVFDYRMRPGVVERSNAIALMRTIGLDV